MGSFPETLNDFKIKTGLLRYVHERALQLRRSVGNLVIT